jgi:hypothetical protein
LGQKGEGEWASEKKKKMGNDRLLWEEEKNKDFPFMYLGI